MSAELRSISSCNPHQASNTPSAPPTTQPPTGQLPRHFLTGYWHNFVNAAVELRLRDVPAEYDLVAVAFAEATATPGAVTFTVDPALSTALGGYTNSNIVADIATLHSRGKRVVVSVGGELGRVTVNDSASATNFANTVFNLMQTFGFDGVDIDLENGLNPTFMAQALHDEPITVHGDGSQTRSLCYVDDLVEGIRRLATSSHVGPMNIGGPEELTVLALAELIRNLVGSRSEIVFTGRPVDDPNVRCPDITLAREALGWEPTVDLGEGLGRTLEWAKERW